MHDSSRIPVADPLLGRLSEMGERINAFDWSKTPLGPAESWSPALRMAVRLMLANRLPMLLWWGPQYICIYNDPYCPVLGNKHPWGLGRPVSECWREIWHILKPLIDTPFHGGPATWDEDILLVINRFGFNEETHWLIAYSPVPDENMPTGIGGVLATVHETTAMVLSERRMTALRDLGSHPGEAKTAQAACIAAAKTLEAHAKDIPFALLYLLEPDGTHARLAATAGIAAGHDIGQALMDLNASESAWPLAEAKQTMQPQIIADLAARFASIPPGPWPDPPTSAVVLPIGSGKPHEPLGFLVAGISSRLRLDDSYRGFLDLVTTQVGTAIANARSHEAEVRRAEALAELDRAKTTFFSNVSHEFRTPLTLILGPLEDAIGDTQERWQRDRLLTLQRNALRLQKLVNTLLDFSRLEAGRVQVSYQPVDLAALTQDLASNFRSACEKAGLELRVDCPPMPESVHVDTEMWEKIVLNLLSNAFKFTHRGLIEVSLRPMNGSVALTVKDTGVGVPADQLPRLFERFHRIEGVSGRSQEGSGIGLALVRELVRLHGGNIHAESALGEGTSFTVTIPVGTDHLPPAKVLAVSTANATASNATALRSTHYVEEALRWLPDADQPGELPDDSPQVHDHASANHESERPRILMADDNADMRQYVTRLLSPSYQVQTVADGVAALDAARTWKPGLVLTDIMMPRLDGFGLLKELRADPATSKIPIIMLSARAGEESRIEGVEAGADDYMVKPFSARELLARVSAQLQMARLRQEASETLRAQELELREAQRVAHIGSWRWDAESDVTTGSEELFRIYGLDPAVEEFPDFKDQDGTLYPHESWQRINEAVQATMRTGVGYELDVQALRNGEPIWITTRCEVVRDVHGAIVGLLGTVQDITRRKQAEEALLQADRRKDEFLATLAHELRNPLAPIRNGLQVLRLGGTNGEMADDACKMMERQLSQMVRLIDDLLDLSRISRGKIEFKKERVELAKVVQHAVETSRPLIEQANHELLIDVPTVPIYVDADVTRLAQVLANLLNNAAKYTERGGRIQLGVQRRGSEVAISVRDNGLGIPAHMLPKVFDMFTQVDRNLERSQGGLGIGLSIVKRLVEMHGGSVEVKSDGHGMGSQFVIRLPVVLSVAHPSSADEQATSPSTRRRILVVDDNRDAAMSLAMMLKLMGNEAKTAHDGMEALDVAAAYRPDLILLDIGMPRLNGHETAKRIREQPWGKNIVLVALTGWGQEEDRRRSDAAGFDFHMVKPIEPSALEKLLARFQANTA